MWQTIRERAIFVSDDRGSARQHLGPVVCMLRDSSPFSVPQFIPILAMIQGTGDVGSGISINGIIAGF